MARSLMPVAANSTATACWSCVPCPLRRDWLLMRLDRYGLEVVFLVTPETPDERIRAIDGYAHSFIYAVSSAATTGAQRSFDEQKQAYFARLQSMQLAHPFLIGFGISNRATREAADAYSAGVIVGSKFVSLLEQSADSAEAVEALHRCLAS